jgi:hypothetical protein
VEEVVFQDYFDNGSDSDPRYYRQRNQCCNGGNCKGSRPCSASIAPNGA